MSPAVEGASQGLMAQQDADSMLGFAVVGAVRGQLWGIRGEIRQEVVKAWSPVLVSVHGTNTSELLVV